MTEEMFPIATYDADRERIRARARLTRDVLADLEEAALSAASRHTHQVDALKTELAEAQCQLDALATRTPVDSMTVGLDDIRTILVEETHTTVRELLVLEDGQVQVVDSIHQLLAHVAMLSDAVQKAYADRDRAIQAAADERDAAADQYNEEYYVLTGKVRALGLAIRPVNSGAAEIVARCDVLAAIDVVAQAVTELAGQIVDGGRGETARALALAQADANRIEDEIHAIEAVCEAAGMPATVEREDIPAWLAEHLTTRAEKKAKAKKAKKNVVFEDDERAPGVEVDDG
jgi:hypothetical protein